MKISRIKFVIMFVVFAFAFLLGTTQLLDQRVESFAGSHSQKGWQAAASTILSPLKAVIVGPILPVINLLKQDPDTPPPFYLAGFAFCWTIMGLILYYVVGKLRAGLRRSQHAE